MAQSVAVASRIFVAMSARWLVIVLVLPLLAFDSHADRYRENLYKVIKVLDGDSLIVKDARGQQYKVRLSAIDAPEYRQPYGEASKQSLRGLLTGREVRLDVLKTDPYGRWVAVVWVAPTGCDEHSDARCDKNLDAGLFQVERGFAWWYRYWGQVRKEQSSEDQLSYERAEQSARRNKLGLWRDPNPINPREWRKQHPR